MSREVSNVLCTGIDIYNCVICIAILFSTFFAHKSKPQATFRALTVAVFLFNISDFANWIAEGTAKVWFKPYLEIMTFVYFMLIPVTTILLIKYIIDYVDPEKVRKGLFKVICFIAALYGIGVILSPFFSIFYYISPDNYYHRGNYYLVSSGFNALLFVLGFTIVVQNYRFMTKKAFFTFSSYSFLPIITYIIQYFNYGLGLTNTGMTISLLLIFINIHGDLEQSFVKNRDEIRSKEQKLIDFQEHTIASLSNLVENRDIETGEHAQRTALFVGQIAYQCKSDGIYSNILTEAYIKRLIKAAPMHDIGKIVVSDIVLKKPGKLSEDEFERMKVHAKVGGKIVSDIMGNSEDKEYIQIAIDITQSHHERWDGTGYPNQLKGEKIPLCARIMAIADVFDALIFERCYKAAIPVETAFDIITKEAGTHFDPVLVQEFLKAKPEILRIISEEN